LNCEISSIFLRQQWQLSIGCHPSVALYTLPKFLPQLLAKYPQLKVSLIHGLSRDITKKVIDSKIDMGIVMNPLSQPELIIKTIASDEVCLWESPHNLNKSTLIFDPSLAQSQWLLRRLEKEGV